MGLENINFKAISSFKSNATFDNSNRGVIKPNNSGLREDTVEIRKSETVEDDKNNKKSKLLKWGAVVGSGIALATVGLLSVKHISVKNAKKAAEELKKIKLQELEKAKAEQLKKAEEARIAQEKALKAQQEAREKAIQEAKIKAEQEAKIKAEREAKILAEQKEQIKKGLINDFDEKLGPDVLKEILGSSEIDKMNAFENGVIDTLKKAEEKGLEGKDIKSLYSTLAEKNNYNDSQIEAFIADSSLFGSFKSSTRHEFIARRDLLQGVETLKQTIPQKEGEKYSKYIERLMETHKSNTAIKNEKHVKELRSNIHYSDVEPAKPELTDDELQILKEWRPNIYGKMSKEEALKSLSETGYSWARTYTSEELGGNLPENIEHILLSKAMPKYNSQTFLMKYGQKRAIPQPVARWMDVPCILPDGSEIKDPEKFIHDTFKVGEKYVAPAKQSCSINLKSAGDACFSDDYPHDLKFIIHPKSSTSKAACIADVVDYTCKYGHNEVVYPKGTEFKVLDKRLEDFTQYDGNHHYSWVIEMQEA